MHCSECGLFFDSADDNRCRLCDGPLTEDLKCSKCGGRNFAEASVCTICNEPLSRASALGAGRSAKPSIQMDYAAVEESAATEQARIGKAEPLAEPARPEPSGWVPPSQRGRSGQSSSSSKGAAQPVFSRKGQQIERRRNSSASGIQGFDQEKNYNVPEFLASQMDYLFSAIFVLFVWLLIFFCEEPESRAFLFSIFSVAFGGVYFFVSTPVNSEIDNYIMIQLEMQRISPLGMLCHRISLAIGLIALLWGFVAFFGEGDWTMTMIWVLGLVPIIMFWFLNFIIGVMNGKEVRAEVANDFFMVFGTYSVGLLLTAAFAVMVMFGG